MNFILDKTGLQFKNTKATNNKCLNICLFAVDMAYFLISLGNLYFTENANNFFLTLVLNFLSFSSLILINLRKDSELSRQTGDKRLSFYGVIFLLEAVIGVLLGLSLLFVGTSEDCFKITIFFMLVITVGDKSIKRLINAYGGQ